LYIPRSDFAFSASLLAFFLVKIKNKIKKIDIKIKNKKKKQKM